MSPTLYFSAFAVPVVAGITLAVGGAWTWLVPVVVFGLVPLLELRWQGSTANLDEAGEMARRSARAYDLLLYLLVPTQYAVLAFFCVQVAAGAYTGLSLVGAVATMATLCGALGINVAHELGHRRGRFDQFMSKALLLTSLYLHFFIEHNRGHHARVATLDDPATSRRGETLYAFWFRSVTMSWRHAWQMEFDRLARRGLPRWGWSNEMVRFSVVQAAFVAGIFLAFGGVATLAFAVAAAGGALLLETVNYIEHYGLLRSRRPDGRLERVQPIHSWNANHPIGRVLLFELTRHSDHHANPRRPYPVLRHFDEAPQLPTGYPGMMMLAFLPPLFFRVMHARLEGARAAAQAA